MVRCRAPEALGILARNAGLGRPADCAQAGFFAVGELLQRADDENGGDVVIHLYFVPSSAEYAG